MVIWYCKHVLPFSVHNGGHLPNNSISLALSVCPNITFQVEPCGNSRNGHLTITSLQWTDIIYKERVVFPFSWPHFQISKCRLSIYSGHGFRIWTFGLYTKCTCSWCFTVNWLAQYSNSFALTFTRPWHWTDHTCLYHCSACCLKWYQ